MHDELVLKVAELMNEQAAAYGRLEAATTQLNAALVRGIPDNIEALTRAGESELLRMRSRLLQITASLTKFSELRARDAEKTPVEEKARQEFEMAAKQLLEAARSFQKIHQRAASLTRGGSSFTSACIQMCGVPPTTYRAPVLKYGEGMR